MTKEFKTGDKAPDIILNNQNNEEIVISKIKSKKIIFFYPKDNTPGCTKEAIGFSGLLQDFNKLNCILYGISKDDYKKHTRFIEKYSLKINLLSDIEGKTCMDYRVWKEKSMYGKKYMGIERTTFLLDEKNFILNIWNKVKVNNHAEEVLAFFKN